MSKIKKRFVSLKGKLIMTSLSIVFALSVALVAVYATTTYNRNVNLYSTANFIAVDISARVYIEAYKYNTSGTATNYSSSITGVSYDSGVGKYYIDLGNTESVEDALKNRNVTLPAPNSGRLNAATVTLPQEFGYESVGSEYLYYKFTVVNTGDTDIHMEVEDDANVDRSNVTCRYSYNAGAGRQLSRSNGFDIISEYTKSNNSNNMPAADTGTADGEGTFSMVAYLTDPSLSSITSASNLKVPVLLRAIKYEYGKGSLTTISLNVDGGVKIDDLQVKLATSTAYNGSYTNVTTKYYSASTGGLVNSTPQETRIEGNNELIFLDVWSATFSGASGVQVAVTCTNKTADYGISAQFIPTGAARNGGWAEFYNYGNDGDVIQAVANANGVSGNTISCMRIFEYSSSGGFANFCFKLDVELIDKTAENVVTSGCTSVGLNRYSVAPSTSGQSIPAYYRSGGTDYVICAVASGSGSWALSNNTLPNNITWIKTSAFAGNSFSQIIIPNSVIRIDSSAFRGSTALSKVIIAGSVHTIGECAFADSRAGSTRWYLALKNGVSNIGTGAFGVDLNDDGGTHGLHSNLHEVKFGSSVKSIAGDAFKEYDASETYAGYMVYAFSPTTSFGFSNAEYFKLGMQSGAGTSIIQKMDNQSDLIPMSTAGTLKTSIAATAYTGNFLLQTSVGGGVARDALFSGITIGDNVEIIGTSAFYRCTHATTLTFSSASPSALTRIDQSAFEGCNNITSGVTLPSSISTLGVAAFKDCAKIASIDVSNLTLTSIPESVFYGCAQASNVLEIPATVTSIGDNAFRACAKISGITFDQDENDNYCIQTIGQRAFLGCSSLPRFTIHQSITTISANAFEACGKLWTIVVDNNAFANQFVEQSSVGYIISNARDVYISTSAITSSSNFLNSVFARMFDDDVDDNNNYRFAPEFSRDHYYVWSTKRAEIYTPLVFTQLTLGGVSVRTSSTATTSGHVRIPSVVKIGGISSPDYDVITVADRGFNGCTGITSMFMSENLTTVGEYGLSGCSNMTELKFHGTGDINKLTSIGNYAFSQCRNLALEVDLPAELELLGSHAFYNCRELISISLDEEAPLEAIGDSAFEDCVKATGTITIPENVTSLGARAFSGCAYITSVEIPEGVTQINSYTFNGCTRLTTLTLNNQEFTAIGQCAFFGCDIKGLSEINISGNIGVQAFYDAIESGGSTTTRINMSGGTEIGNEAFKNSSGISRIDIPNTVTRFGSQIFESTSSLSNIYYDGSIASWDAITRPSGDRTTTRAGNPNNSMDNLYNRNSVTIHFTGYSVILEGSHYSLVSGSRSIANGQTVTLTFKSDVGYGFPSSVNVSSNATVISWSQSTGVLTVQANSDGDVTVSLNMQSNGTTLTINITSAWNYQTHFVIRYIASTGYIMDQQIVTVSANGSVSREVTWTTAGSYYVVFRDSGDLSERDPAKLVEYEEYSDGGSTNVTVTTQRKTLNNVYVGYTRYGFNESTAYGAATIRADVHQNAVANITYAGVVEFTPTLTVTHTNCSVNAPSSMAANETLNLTFTKSNDSYLWPDTVTVNRASYTWNKNTGVLTLYNPTGNVAVTVVAQVPNTLTVDAGDYLNYQIMDADGTVLSTNASTTISNANTRRIKFTVKNNSVEWAVPIQTITTNAHVLSYTRSSDGRTEGVLVINQASGNVTVTAVARPRLGINIEPNNVTSDSNNPRYFYKGDSFTLHFSKTAGSSYTLPSSSSGVSVKTLDTNGEVLATLSAGTHYTWYSNGTLVMNNNIGYSVLVTVTGVQSFPLTVNYNSANSSYTLDGPADVPVNGSRTITLTANSGYAVPATVAVSGATQSWSRSNDGATGTLILSNATGNVTVYMYVVSKYSVTINLGTHVTQSGSGANYIISGSSTSYTFATNDNTYVFTNSSVNVTNATSSWNASTGALTISNPQGNVTITVNATKRYTIDTSNSTNVSCSGASTILSGGSATLTFTATNGRVLPKRSRITVTGVSDGNWTWNQATGVMTLSNPISNVIVTVPGVVEYSITLQATNVTETTGYRTIAGGEEVILSFSANAGYTLPSSILVKFGDTVIGSTYYEWTQGTGQLRLKDTINANVTVVIAGVGNSNSINWSTNSQHVTKTSGANTITSGVPETLVFEADSGYELPDTIIVTVGGNVANNTYYTWNKSTGTLNLTSAVNNAVVITIVAEEVASGNGYNVTIDWTYHFDSGFDGEVDGYIRLYDSEDNVLAEFSYIGSYHGQTITGVHHIDLYNDWADYSAIRYTDVDGAHWLEAYQYSTETLTLTKNITITGCNWPCLLADTEIDVWDDKKKRWKRKKIKDLRPEDKIRVWNFDEGREDVADILWLQEPLNAERYTRVTFSDGGILEVVGPGDHKRHAIFVKETGRFEYINVNLIGKTVVNAQGEDVKITKVEFVDKSVEYYNIVTNRHFNCYTNGYLTSTTLSNIYPVKDMKYVKDGRTEIKISGLDAYEQMMYDGLRMGERRIGKGGIQSEMDRMTKRLRTFMTKSTDKRIEEIVTAWMLSQKADK